MRSRRLLLPAVSALALVFAAACGGGGSGSNAIKPQVITPNAGTITPVIVSSDLAIGESRFAFAVTDDKGVPIQGEPVHVGIVDPKGNTVTEQDAAWRPLHHVEADPAQAPDALIRGIYDLETTFTGAGRWQAQVTARGQQATVSFDVAEKSQTPAIGADAPTVDNPVLPQANIKEIDSSDPPHPELHQMTIAQAVHSGRPTVLVFATPAFCQSRICGPVLDEVLDTYSTYSDRVNYLHVEPYTLTADGQPIAAAGGGLQTVEAVQRYGLPTEPWVFIIDARGKIAAKFEGTVSSDEVAQAIQAVLS